MGAVMTFLTQERRTRFQQWRDVGAVRCVAICAILGRRLVLPQERTAFLCMAGIAGLGHRRLLEHLGAGGTVRIVTVRTDDLARIDRMGRYLVGIGALILVTGKADLGLRLSVAHLVDRCMYLVAVVARDLVVLVLATVPVGAVGAFMAAQALAGANLVVRHRIGAFLENDIRRSAPLDIGITLQMLFAFTVAGLAIRCAGITPDPMFGLVNGQDWRCLAFIVTARADRISFQGLLSRLGPGRFHSEIRKFVFRCRLILLR